MVKDSSPCSVSGFLSIDREAPAFLVILHSVMHNVFRPRWCQRAQADGVHCSQTGSLSWVPNATFFSITIEEEKSPGGNTADRRREREDVGCLTAVPGLFEIIGTKHWRESHRQTVARDLGVLRHFCAGDHNPACSIRHCACPFTCMLPEKNQRETFQTSHVMLQNTPQT